MGIISLEGKTNYSPKIAESNTETDEASEGIV
jgi:hypothetical protein